MKFLKNAIKYIIRTFGYKIIKIKKSVNNITEFGIEIRRIPELTNPAYELIRPIATYSPWNTDSSFHTTYSFIKSYTMVDIYRCYELWQMIEQSAKLEYGNIFECGVWRGGTGALIAKQAINCGINDTVYLCDTFRGVVKAGSKDTKYVGGEHISTREPLEELILKLNLKNVKILEGIFPDETSALIEANQKFRLCHIDVDVYESAKDIVNWIWDKLVPGGIIIFDDYGFDTCDGITKYVEELRYLNDRMVIHNLNGHAILIKKNFK